MPAPVASGWSIAGRAFHPLESAAFARRTPILAIHRPKFRAQVRSVRFPTHHLLWQRQRRLSARQSNHNALIFLNILLLAGSIYLMLVYDSVLPSHNLATLEGLLLMVALVYGFQGMLDTMRARIMGDVANALERPLSARAQQAMFRSSLSSAAGTGDPLQPMRDLDHVRAFLGGSGPMTLLDLP